MSCMCEGEGREEGRGLLGQVCKIVLLVPREEVCNNVPIVNC